ncbi:hypothetical protein KIPB_006811 [Kipferlia bialata]|uniref:Uncharacterized protein n=2 Tax=Kipferlia bialata TaxID=797122 RepID=A0A9K3CXJ2_9EUKA|nr:hypothetical protein KIPB_006811 [Kipferlia bialata]|eukprot:g6811.t1
MSTPSDYVHRVSLAPLAALDSVRQGAVASCPDLCTAAAHTLRSAANSTLSAERACLATVSLAQAAAMPSSGLPPPETLVSPAELYRMASASLTPGAVSGSGPLPPLAMPLCCGVAAAMEASLAIGRGVGVGSPAPVAAVEGSEWSHEVEGAGHGSDKLSTYTTSAMHRLLRGAVLPGACRQRGREREGGRDRVTLHTHCYAAASDVLRNTLIAAAAGVSSTYHASRDADTDTDTDAQGGCLPRGEALLRGAGSGGSGATERGVASLRQGLLDPFMPVLSPSSERERDYEAACLDELLRVSPYSSGHQGEGVSGGVSTRAVLAGLRFLLRTQGGGEGEAERDLRGVVHMVLSMHAQSDECPHLDQTMGHLGLQ